MFQKFSTLNIEKMSLHTCRRKWKMIDQIEGNEKDMPNDSTKEEFKSSGRRPATHSTAERILFELVWDISGL